jgi:AraC family transcriptional regulator of adaptative response / DNA-3-methyladenine glycosylase II
LHFAKRLIDETHLPMTQVALASGFSSIRRFNATFVNLYGRTPTQLRAASSKSQARGEQGRYVFHLSYRPPNVPPDYRKRLSLDGRSGRISVRPIRGKNQVELQIDYPEPAALLRIVNMVRRKLDLL